MRPVGRQHRVKCLQRGRRQLRQRDPEVGGAVARHDAGAAAVGDDGKPVADRVEAAGERLGSSEQLADGLHPHHPGTVDGGVEHVVGADQRGSVRHRRTAAGIVTPDLDQQHRLDPCRRPQRAHETARVPDALDVEQDAACLCIQRQIVEDLAEVDIGRRAHRDHAGEADIVALRPVEDCGAERTRLRDEGDMPLPCAALVEGRVEADARPHHAEAVRPDQAYAIAPRHLKHALLQRDAGRTRLAEARSDHHRRRHALQSAVLEDPGHRLCRRGHHGEIDRLADGPHRGPGTLAMDTVVVRIDRIQRAAKAAREHVAQHNRTHRVGAVAGAHHCHRARLEQGAQIVPAGHGRGYRRVIGHAGSPRWFCDHI